MTYRAVIVEDETLARQAIRAMVDAVPWLECQAEAKDGREACRLIDQHDPDVVFLDVRIPECSGLEVLATIERTPFVVFTTAYVDFAVDAFEHGAVDYLVKPFGEARFRRTLERIRERLAAREEIDLPSRPLARVFIRQGNTVLPLAIDSVQLFEAAGDYVIAHQGKERFVLSTGLTRLEAQLDAENFVRVHRSMIVNLKCVIEMRREDGRRIELRLENGRRVIASRSGSSRLRRLCL